MRRRIHSGLYGPGPSALEDVSPGASLVVRWLRLHLPRQGIWGQSLVRELRYHMPLGQKTETSNGSSIVENSIKTFKTWSI